MKSLPTANHTQFGPKTLWGRSLLLAGLGLTLAGAAAAQVPLPSLSAVSTDPQTLPSVTIPLNVRFGQSSNATFLYSSLAPTPSPDGLPTIDGPRRTAFGFNHSVSLAKDALHLNGQVYFAGTPGTSGSSSGGGQGRALSEALAYSHKGWQFDAHFQSVGKAFQSAESLTDSGRFDGQRGHDEFGFAAARADTNGKFGLSLVQNEDTTSHTQTQTQSLSFGRTLGRGIQMEASQDVVRSRPESGAAQTNTATHLSLNWQTQKMLTFQAHWAEAGQTGANGNAPQGSRQQDLTATLAIPDGKRAGRLRHSQAVIHLAQSLAQGKMQNDTRALSFNTDLTDTHVGLELTSCRTGADQNADTITGRSLRIASIAPGDWLHYSLYYKQRQHSLGGRITDIRSYDVQVPLRRLAFSYHYLNGSEDGGGGVCDTVDTRYQIGGPLYRTLSWNVQYDQSNNFAGTAGVENFLLGIQGILGPGRSLQLALGRPEQRSGGESFVGRSYQLAYEFKVDSADTVAFNGEMTTWLRGKSTRSAVPPTTAKVRLNLAKAF